MTCTAARRTGTAVLAAGLAFGVTLVAGVAPASAAAKSKTPVVVDGGTLNGGTLNGGTLNGGTLNGGTLDGGTLNGGSLDGGTLNGGTLNGGTLN
jgi:hypothetical protein